MVLSQAHEERFKIFYKALQNKDYELVNSFSSEELKDYMTGSFFTSCEDPVNNCPYKDGKYLFIHGGPHNALNVLQSEFSGLISDDLINELAKELEEECIEWSSTPSKEWYENEYIEAISSNVDPFKYFKNSFEDFISLLNTTNVEEPLQQTFLGLLHINMITIVETYLSDMYFVLISKDTKNLKRFVESYKDFKQEKFLISDVYKEFEGIEDKVKKKLSNISWHNLANAKVLYGFFDIEFPDISFLSKAVAIRHDLVHRNGKNNNGQEIFISKDHLADLLGHVVKFVTKIELQILEKDF